MASAVANLANNETAPTYPTGGACTLTTAPTVSDYQNGNTITFTSATKGNASIKRDVTCNAGSGGCTLAGAGTGTGT